VKKKLVLYGILLLVVTLVVADVFVAGGGHVEVVEENVSLVEENNTLTEQNQILTKENQTLTQENSQLTQENSQLNEKVSVLENTTRKYEKTTSNINDIKSFEFAVPIQDSLSIHNNKH
jgi:hypothetical protein